MYSRKISDINYIKELSLEYVKQNKEGYFYLQDCWDKEEALCSNVDYYTATKFFKQMVHDLNKSDGV
jgi:hypothetical protein